MLIIKIKYIFIIILLYSFFSFAMAAIPPVARVIHDEALRSNQDPIGRPLPLIAHWHRQSLPLNFQIQMIRSGIPILPWLDYGKTYTAEKMQSKYGEALTTLREWNLPFAMLTGGQWEQDFYKSAEYKALPIEETGVGMNLDGSKMAKVSPFSPVKLWYGLGVKWTDNPAAQTIQQLYPNPPLVLFISNNEATDVRWYQAEKEKRYLELYGSDKTGEFKRKIFGDHWIERYTALFQGMREGLKKPVWKKNIRFIGYNAFGPDHWGRWGAWKRHSLVTSNRIDPSWFMWQGGIVEAYDNNWEPKKTAFTLWSMQSEMMNLVFMKEEAFSINPEFWFELIFWDGDTWRKENKKRANYDEQGVDYTPELYSGWLQYNLWTLTPRVAREWRASNDNQENWWPYFQSVIAAVTRIHNDPVLTRFWRKGELVANRSRKHPFSYVREAKWENVDRWFALNTNLDPSLPFRNGTGNYGVLVPVWALARVIGKNPNREWLIYAHAPLGEKNDIAVTIPEYKTVVLKKITVSGSFYHIQESSGSINSVGYEQASPTNLK